MGVPPGNRRVLVSVPERYVPAAGTRGRQEGRPCPRSQQVIHEISGVADGYGLPSTKQKAKGACDE